jgi:hypothetical protein
MAVAVAGNTHREPGSLWVQRVKGLRGSAWLHTRVTGSAETATGTAGHEGSDLRKDRVTRVLPDSSGFLSLDL